MIPFKVVESHVSGDFVLVEVLHVEAIINGSAVSAARLDELKKKHRRHKRDVKRKTLSLEKTFKKENKLSVSVRKCLLVSNCLQHRS